MTKTTDKQKTTHNYSPSPRGKKAGKPKGGRPEARRRAVVEKTAEGKSQRQIAAEVGISQARVKQIQREPDTQLRVQGLLSPHRARIEKIVEKMLDSLEASLEAVLLNNLGMPMKQPDGSATPDHLNRNRAISNALKMLALTEPKNDIPIVTTITLEQLEAMLQEEGLI